MIRIPGNKTAEVFLVDLLYRLLNKDPARRPQSVREVKQHSWFAGIDWTHLCAKKYVAPFVPREFLLLKFVKENGRLPAAGEEAFEYDTRFFSPKQTKKEVTALQTIVDQLVSHGQKMAVSVPSR